MIDYTPKKKVETYAKFSNKYSTDKKYSIDGVVVTRLYVRETNHYPSKVTPGGSGVLKERAKYTGDNLIGISVIHKSCMQPIFDKQLAKDVAKMRR